MPYLPSPCLISPTLLTCRFTPQQRTVLRKRWRSEHAAALGAAARDPGGGGLRDIISAKRLHWERPPSHTSVDGWAATVELDPGLLAAGGTTLYSQVGSREGSCATRSARLPLQQSRLWGRWRGEGQRGLGPYCCYSHARKVHKCFDPRRHVLVNSSNCWQCHLLKITASLQHTMKQQWSTKLLIRLCELRACSFDLCTVQHRWCVVLGWWLAQSLAACGSVQGRNHTTVDLHHHRLPAKCWMH